MRFKYELSIRSHQLLDVVSLDLVVFDRSSPCPYCRCSHGLGSSDFPFAAGTSGPHHSLSYLGSSQFNFFQFLPFVLQISPETTGAPTNQLNLFDFWGMDQVDTFEGHASEADGHFESSSPCTFAFEGEDQTAVSYCLRTLKSFLEGDIHNISGPDIGKQVFLAALGLLLLLLFDHSFNVVLEGAWFVEGRNKLRENHLGIFPFGLSRLAMFVVESLSRQPLLIIGSLVVRGTLGGVPDDVALSELVRQGAETSTNQMP